MDLLFDRKQSPESLYWIDKARMEELNDPASSEIEAILRSLEEEPPKFVLLNYRIAVLPERLRDSIFENYRGLWGGILGYAPTVGQGSFGLAYSGTYAVDSGGKPVVIDGQAVDLTGPIQLEAGEHQAELQGTMTLVLLPDSFQSLVDPEFRQNRPLFPNVYDF